MGIGQALTEGTQLDELGRQRNPHLLDYKLVTASDAPEIAIDWIETDTPNAGPKGSKGVGEPPCVPTAGAIANAIAKVIGARVDPAADDARSASGRPGRRDGLRDRHTVEEALAALAGGARPVAGGTDLVVGARQGKAPLPDVARRDPPCRRSSTRSTTQAGSLRLGALVTHAEIAAHPAVRERFTALADASAIVGSHATRAQGTIGGNVMNASPAMETGGPLICLGATVDPALGRRARAPSPSRSSSPARARRSRTGDELLVAVDVPAPAPGTGSAYVRLEYRRQMEIAVVGATAVVTLDGRPRAATPGSPSRRSRPTIRRVPEAEAALAGGDGGRRGGDRGRRPRGRRGVRPDLRRARLGALSPRDGRGDRAPRRRDRRRPGARHRRPDSRQRSPPVKVAATLSVNGVAYPVELEPGTSLLAAVRDVRRPDRREGGLRRLRVRRLHDAPRREAGEQLLVPRAPGRGQRGDDRRGPRARRRAEPAPGGVPRARRRPVRLLHARDADLGDRAPRARTRRRRPTRCGSRCPATSAAAPATTASSRPCSPSPTRARGTARPGARRPRRRGRGARPSSGGAGRRPRSSPTRRSPRTGPARRCPARRDGSARAARDRSTAGATTRAARLP